MSADYIATLRLIVWAQTSDTADDELVHVYHPPIYRLEISMLDDAAEDKIARERWQHLLQSAYNTCEDRIRAAGDLYPCLVNILIR
jgi:hypothetical protein